MSIERMFDKLDEKISSLIRSLGLIITLLFGSMAFLINYSMLEYICSKICILGLITIFFGDIIYALYLYVGTKNDEFIHNLQLYEQLLIINNNFMNDFHEILDKLMKDYAIIDKRLPSKKVSGCFSVEYLRFGVKKSEDGKFRFEIKLR